MASSEWKPPVNVCVSDAQDSTEGYMVYVVKCETGDPTISINSQPKWQLSKRYSQIHTLHEKLVAKSYFSNALPPMPQKKAMGSMDPDFVMERREQLHTYLNTVSKIPYIYADADWCAFLEIQLMPLPIADVMKQCTHSGWLFKQGKWNPGWKKRWCVLKDGFLLYFKAQEDSSPTGMFGLKNCTVVSSEKRDNSFGIYNPMKRTFYMAAESASQCTSWIAALNGGEMKVGLNDFELLTVLGQGAFGKVIRVKKKDSTDIFAMKVLKKDAVRAQQQVEHTRTERQVLQRVKHPYVVELHYAFHTEDKLYMVMDYVNGGELFTHLKREKRFPESRARLYAAEVLLALEYLHSMGFAYRDLKPENLLVDSDGHVRMTDFGLAKSVERGKSKTFCGTPEYMAPEILTEEGHAFEVDWWALGVLIYEMMVGLPPFYSRNKKEMYFKILKNEPRFPKSMGSAARDIIGKLLHKEPAKRLGSGPKGVQEIKEHEYWQDLDWGALLRREIPAEVKPVIKKADDTSNFDAMHTRRDPVETYQQASKLGGGGPSDEFSGFTFEQSSVLQGSGSDDSKGKRPKGMEVTQSVRRDMLAESIEEEEGEVDWDE